MLIADDNGTRAFDLSYDGKSFVLHVESVVKGKVRARAVFIAPSGDPGNVVDVIPDEIESIDSSNIIHAGGRTWVSFTRDGDVFARSLGSNAALGDVLALHSDPTAHSAWLHPVGDDFDLLLYGPYGGAAGRAVRVTASGTPIAGPQTIFDQVPGPGQTYTYSWLWPDRVIWIHGAPPGPFTINVAPFAYGAPPTPGVPVFVSEGSAHLTHVLSGEPALAGVYDTTLGATVLELGRDYAESRYEIPEAQGKRPSLTRDGECGFGVAVDHGTFSADDIASSELSVHLLDRDFRRIAPVAAMPVASGVCLESRHQIVAGPQGLFGVMWQEGCSGTRRLKFAIVRAVAG